MREFLRELTARYDAYVDGYRASDGALPGMMQLKRDHTARVVDSAGLIADGERFDPRLSECALAAALLHDTGRYEQLRRYDTFQDSKSVDHAVFSHDIVRDLGWLDGHPDRDAILAAVLCHNRRDLPADLDGFTRTLANAVRDADKLDIFRVLEELVSKSDWRTDRQAFWNLSVDAPPNPEVVRRIAAGLPVDYQHIRSLADFVLIQVGWILNGLAFATSRRLARARGHLEFRRRFLRELTDDPAVDRLFAAAEEAEEAGPRRRTWYVLHVKPRTEKKVAEHLAALRVFRYVPLFRKVTKVQRRRVVRELPVFPGYVFTRLFPEERRSVLETRQIVRTIEVSCPRQMIHQLRQVEHAGRTPSDLRVVQSFAAGERVRVVSGPLRGLEGQVVRRGAETKLILSVDILGRALEASVQPTDLQKLASADPC